MCKDRYHTYQQNTAMVRQWQLPYVCYVAVSAQHLYDFWYTLWLFNIAAAMENGPFIDGLPVYLLKIVIFHGYVK